MCLVESLDISHDSYPRVASITIVVAHPEDAWLLLRPWFLTSKLLYILFQSGHDNQAS